MKPPPSSNQAARISQQLSRWVKRTSDHWRFNRIHVVNPELCHDALNRLAPSLKAHHRCDLIDVNPGVSLWSRHLHAILKPRRHILVEPELDAFGDFIRPLLQEQGSSYRHVNNLKDAFDKDLGLLSDRNIRQHTSTPITYNTSLVLNFNLTGAYKPAAREAGTNAKYFINISMHHSLVFGIKSSSTAWSEFWLGYPMMTKIRSSQELSTIARSSHSSLRPLLASRKSSVDVQIAMLRL